MCLSSLDCSQIAGLDLVSRKFSTRAKQNDTYCIVAVCYYLCNGFWKVIIYFRNWLTKIVYVCLIHEMNWVSKNICQASQLLPRVQRKQSLAQRIKENIRCDSFFFAQNMAESCACLLSWLFIRVSQWSHFSCIHFSSSVCNLHECSGNKYSGRNACSNSLFK